MHDRIGPKQRFWETKVLIPEAVGDYLNSQDIINMQAPAC